jgi:hypothetical protein
VIIQIPSERVIQIRVRRKVEIRDERASLSVSEGDEIEGEGKPGERDGRWIQGFETKEKRVFEGPNDVVGVGVGVGFGVEERVRMLHERGEGKEVWNIGEIHGDGLSWF